MSDYEKCRDEAAEKYFYQYRNPIQSASTLVGVTQIDEHFKAGSDWGYERGKAYSFDKWLEAKDQLEAANAKIAELEKRTDTPGGKRLYRLMGELNEAESLLAKMAEALEGFITLLDEQVLVRNTDDDHNIMKFLDQSIRLTGHLEAVDTALAAYVAWESRNG